MLVGWLLVAALAGLLVAACSGADSDAAPVTAQEENGEASGESASGDLSAPDSLSQTESSSSKDTDANRDGEPSVAATGKNTDDDLAPQEERVSPLGAFLTELRSEVFGDHDFSDPMGSIERMKHDCMTEQGFRYAEIDWAAIDAEFEATTPSLAEEDYMPTRGYGIADSLDAPDIASPVTWIPTRRSKPGCPLPNSKPGSDSEASVRCEHRTKFWAEPGSSAGLFETISMH